MSFFRQITESIIIKKEAENTASIYAIGSSYSLLSCSPALLNSASLDNANVKNQIAQFNLHSHNIGLIYNFKLNYDKALEFYSISLKIREEIGDKKGIASNYINIGNVYHEQGNLTKALEIQQISLKIRLEIDDKRGIATSYNNIGIIYTDMGDYSKSLENHIASLKIREEIGDKEGIAMSHINFVSLYLAQNKIKEAKEHSVLSLQLAKELGSKEMMRQSYHNLAICDTAQGNWKSAFENHKLFKLYNDSIYNEESSKKTAQMTAQYESEKKESQIKILEKEKEKQAALTAAETKRQRIVLIAVSLGLALLLFFSVFLYNRYRITQKQKDIITQQKSLVEQKNKEITQSIEYALRIQSAILPPQKIVKQHLEKSFIFYKPKDIVAGDFYWMEIVDELVIFAACDCTGHGVPGAMVSVVCHNALNRAVREFGLTQPAAILDKTAEIVIENFAKSEAEIKDGMDISLCTLNTLSKEIQWAGANNPIWIIPRSGSIGKPNELIETKADKQSIGINESLYAFTNHVFKLNAGDRVYLFTDGFADQFGGEKGEKKVTRKRFKELIVSLQNKSMPEQQLAIEEFLKGHQKEAEQVDDILVMGVMV